ncbi:MAG: SBBP repeat-containing protein [Chloroflexota bacterium]
MSDLMKKRVQSNALVKVNINQQSTSASINDRKEGSVQKETMIQSEFFLRPTMFFKFFWLAIFVFLIITMIQILRILPEQNGPIRYPNPQSTLATIPLSFIPNVGQSHSDIHFTIRSLRTTLLISPEKIVLNLKQATSDNSQPATVKAISLIFENSNPDTVIQGQDMQAGTVNYFLGNDPTDWHTNIPTYEGIVYTNLYPGIDLHYEGHQGNLKSTYFIAPQADPSQIGWRYDGAYDVSIEAETGDLLIYVDIDNGENYILREQAPIAWQVINNQQIMVAANYAIAEDNSLSFSVGAYDPAYELIIDPVTLAYGSYLGGTNSDWGETITVDSSGNIYISGNTMSDNFPTKNAYDSSLAVCGYDAFITKIDPSKSGDDSLVYSTYLGGSGNCANDDGLGIAVDSAGNAYVTGFVQAHDFPTVNAYDTTKGDGTGGADDTSNDAFITKLNPTGNALLYSTYLGGNDRVDDIGYGLTLDASGNVYITGQTLSDSFPTRNSYQSSRNGSGLSMGDGFIAKIDTSKSGDASLIYSSYLGGSNNDQATGISADDNGKAYITGQTDSTNFPTRNSYQGSYGGGDFDAFVAGFDTTKSGDSSLIYSSYLGGSGDEGKNVNPYNAVGGIARDSAGNIYITGATKSTNFPIKAPYQSNNAGGYDLFVAKFNPNQSGENSLIYSTYLGGSQDDVGYHLTANTIGNVSVTGSTASSDFPTSAAYQNSQNGGTDVFVTYFDTAGTSLPFSTYLGGSQNDVGRGVAIDTRGNIYITGGTASSNFPTESAYDSTYNSLDGFVVKFTVPSLYLPILVSKEAFPTTVEVGQPITYTYRVINNGDVSLSNLTAQDTPLGTVPFEKTTLLVGESLTTTLTYTVSEDDLPGPLINTVVVTGVFLTDEVTATTKAMVALTYQAALDVGKTASLSTTSVGETITYRYRITNTGNVSLTNLIAKDDPLGLIALTQSSLMPGQTSTGTLTHTVVDNDFPGPLSNTVVVTGIFQTETVTASTTISVILGDGVHIYTPIIVKGE